MGRRSWWGWATRNSSWRPISQPSWRTRETWCSWATRRWRSSRRKESSSPTTLGVPCPSRSTRVSWDPVMAEKAGYKHFMLKEIFEQPWAVRETVLGPGVARDGSGVPAGDRDPRRGAAAGRAGVDSRVRHVVALGARRQVPHRGAGARAGGRRLRVRIPLPRSDRLGEHAGDRDHAVGGDRRHARGAARGQEEGRAQHRDLQRRRQHGDARDRRDGLHARRARDRRGVDEGVHVAAGRAAPAGDVPRRRFAARCRRTPRGRISTRSRSCRCCSSRRSSASRSPRRSPSGSISAATSSISAAASTIRSRSRGR